VQLSAVKVTNIESSLTQVFAECTRDESVDLLGSHGRVDHIFDDISEAVDSLV